MGWLAAAGGVVVKILAWVWRNPLWGAIAALSIAGASRLIRLESQKVQASGEQSTMWSFLANIGIAIGYVGETLAWAMLSTAAASAVSGQISAGFKEFNITHTPGGATLKIAPAHALGLF